MSQAVLEESLYPLQASQVDLAAFLYPLQANQAVLEESLHAVSKGRDRMSGRREVDDLGEHAQPMAVAGPGYPAGQEPAPAYPAPQPDPQFEGTQYDGSQSLYFGQYQ